MTFKQLCETISKHNSENNITGQFSDENSLSCVIVFKQGPWFNKEYTEVERSYRFSSDNKFFLPTMCSSSLFANCLDGTDNGVRLDRYLGSWKIDYCYIEEK